MERDTTTSFWVKFFINAGIPNAAAANYAIVFTENRIQTDMLLDLNKEYLRDMGITVLGDVIAILKHSKAYHEKIAREKVLSSDKMLTQKKAVAAQIVADLLPKEVESHPKIAAAPLQKKVVSLKPTVQSVVGTSVKKAKIAEIVPKKVESHRDDIREKPLLEPPAKRKIAQPASVKTQIIREVAPDKTSVKTMEKSSVFQRLGESIVTSTTAESEPKTQSSIFNRLGTKAAEAPSPKVVSQAVEPRRKLVAARTVKPLKDLDKPTLQSDLESLLQKQTARDRLDLNSSRNPITTALTSRTQASLQKTGTRIGFAGNTAASSAKTLTTLTKANSIPKRLVRPPGAGQDTPALKNRLGTGATSSKAKTPKSVFSRLGIGQ